MARIAKSDNQRIIGWFLNATPEECQLMQDTIRAITDYKAANGSRAPRAAGRPRGSRLQAAADAAAAAAVAPPKRKRGRPPKIQRPETALVEAE